MADALDRIPKPSMPVETEVQPTPSRERDAEEARSAAAIGDDDSTSPQEKR
jgi:outer membrane biosynthesis protein TonB